MLKSYKEKRDTMKIRTNVKDGGYEVINHNEKMASDSNSSIEQKKTLGKKLRLSKETIRELRDSDLKVVAGGAGPEKPPVSNGACQTSNSCP